MRPIDADALMNELMKVRWAYQMLDNTQRADIAMGGLRNAEKKVEEAPTIYVEPRWIPCEEKLPEPSQEVLVTGTNNCVYTSRIVHGEFEYGGNVIAWMPLPEPYLQKGKNDETNRR